MKTTFAITAAALVLSGCAISTASRETPINYVAFHGGTLVKTTADDPAAIGCQNYDQRRTEWDIAVSFPDSYSPTDANGVCRSKEEERLETGPASSMSDRPHVRDAALAARMNNSADRTDVLAR